MYAYIHRHEQALERDELLQLNKEGLILPCTFFTDTISYDDYMTALVNTVFVLCPSGNNPETFRLYEALEVGGIPLFVRPRLDKDFLQFGTWSEYPGQIFNSWLDLVPYMEKISMSDDKTINDLQQSIILWYNQFKLHKKQHLGNILDFALASVDGNDSSKDIKNQGNLLFCRPATAINDTTTATCTTVNPTQTINTTTYGIFWQNKEPNWEIVSSLIKPLLPSLPQSANQSQNVPQDNSLDTEYHSNEKDSLYIENKIDKMESEIEIKFEKLEKVTNKLKEDNLMLYILIDGYERRLLAIENK